MCYYTKQIISRKNIDISKSDIELSYDDRITKRLYSDVIIKVLIFSSFSLQV